MASIGVGLTAQLGAVFWALVLRLIVEFALAASVGMSIANFDEVLMINRPLEGTTYWR